MKDLLSNSRKLPHLIMSYSSQTTALSLNGNKIASFVLGVPAVLGVPTSTMRCLNYTRYLPRFMFGWVVYYRSGLNFISPDSELLLKNSSIIIKRRREKSSLYNRLPRFSRKYLKNNSATTPPFAKPRTFP